MDILYCTGFYVEPLEFRQRDKPKNYLAGVDKSVTWVPGTSRFYFQASYSHLVVRYSKFNSQKKKKKKNLRPQT